MRRLHYSGIYISAKRRAQIERAQQTTRDHQTTELTIVRDAIASAQLSKPVAPELS